MKKGIDVSDWQGAINWPAVKASGVEFAYIKLGGADDGVYFDSMAFANAIECHRARIPYGFYWFFASAHPVAAQLEKIGVGLAQAGTYSLPVGIDIESKRFSPFPHSAEVDSGLALCDALAEEGHDPIIYTGPSFWNNAWAYSVARTKSPMVKYRLWIANYGVQSPSIPMGWTKHFIWQYSQTGSVSGIAGNVDLDESDTILSGGTTMTRGQPREDYGRTYHVIPADATQAEIKAVMDAAYPNRETVGFSYDDAGIGDLSVRRAILWNIPPAKRPEFTAWYVDKWYPGVTVEFRSTTPEIIIPPPNPSTTVTRFGVNVISGNVAHAQRALDAGCTAISGIGMFGQLADLAARYRDKTFMARKYTGGQIPPPDPEYMYEGAQSPYVVYLGLNECDAICYGSVEQIAQRAAWDREMWRKMKAKGRRYAGGGFSVGTPDFTRQDICDAMRTHYAPLYNEGMGINYHLYSPWPNHTPDIWYEMRWRFLFEKCGFNPDPNLAGIFCDETGMDQGSVGGFPACGMSATQVGAWARSFLSASQSDGYGNLLRAAAIFQSGNTTDWNGYNADYAINEIGAAAKAPVTRQLARPRAPSYGEAPIIAPARRKVIAQWE